MLLAAWLGMGNWGLGADPWGGTVISDQVPYQPAVLLDRWIDQTEPLDLDLVIAEDPQIRVAGLTTDTTAIATDLQDHPDPQQPPGTREGVFQKLLLTGTWLPPLDNDDVGFGDLEAGVVLAFPFLRRDTPLIITPRYAAHFLDRPAALDLPNRLFDASFEFRHLRKFGDGPWAMDVAVTLGHYSDYEADDADAFRVSGRGLAVYEAIPGRKWVLGVAYLNRAGATVLPVGGVIFDPSPDVSYELIFPRPRVSWRLLGASPDGLDERWVYFGGELGGGVWSITHPAAGTHDLLTSTDYRVLLGYERNIVGGLSRQFELGYVFGRELEFSSTTPDISLNDTLFARVGLKY
jgi:hypothetical protein